MKPTKVQQLANELVEVREKLKEVSPLMDREKELKAALLTEMSKRQIAKQLDDSGKIQIIKAIRTTKKVVSPQQAISYLTEKGMLDDYLGLDEKRYLLLAEQAEVPGIEEMETEYITVKAYKPDNKKEEPGETQAQFIARVRAAKEAEGVL